MSVLDSIFKLHQSKATGEADVLRELADSISNAQLKGPSSELLDLIFGVTGYDRAAVPGGEAHACATVMTTLINYMRLRAIELGEKQTPSEELDQNLINLIKDSAKLYTEMTHNRNGSRNANRRA